jgi:hypothetical protein
MPFEIKEKLKNQLWCAILDILSGNLYGVQEQSKLRSCLGMDENLVHFGKNNCVYDQKTSVLQ